MTEDLVLASNKAFLAYVEVLKASTGLSECKLLVSAGIARSLISNVRTFNKNRRRNSYISLGLILKLYQVYKVPFRTDELGELFSL